MRSLSPRPHQEAQETVTTSRACSRPEMARYVVHWTVLGTPTSVSTAVGEQHSQTKSFAVTPTESLLRQKVFRE